MRTELYWIEGEWPGRLAIMPRPRGGDWLEDEAKAWRTAGVGVVLSLLTNDEIVPLDLVHEAYFVQTNGMLFWSNPIEDRGIPDSTERITELVSFLAKHLLDGKNVAVHCRQGIGRAAMIAIATLLQLGVGLDEAIHRVSEARRVPVPETAEQRQWLADFARTVVAPVHN